MILYSGGADGKGRSFRLLRAREGGLLTRSRPVDRMTDQRGGIAILTALGFLLFAIPLITSSLNLAQITSIDSRVKTDIAQRQYCGLAVNEYITSLLADTSRWDIWLAANVDAGDSTGATHTETINPCGKNITVTAIQQAVLPPR